MIAALKAILIMEMLAGNPTVQEHKIDPFIKLIMGSIGHLTIESPASLIVPTFKHALESWQITLGAR